MSNGQAADNPDNIQPGDRVKLKSGGVPMVVTNVYESYGKVTMVNVTWDREGMIKKADVPVITLERIQ